MRWRWWRKPSNAACLSSRSSMVTGAIIQPGAGDCTGRQRRDVRERAAVVRIRAWPRGLELAENGARRTPVLPILTELPIGRRCRNRFQARDRHVVALVPAAVRVLRAGRVFYQHRRSLGVSIHAAR
jgi:hypothetical protein